MDPTIRDEPFPARAKQASGNIVGVATEASSLSFSDKIMITISQGGRLAHWIQVPLSPSSSNSVDMAPLVGNSSLNASIHLTPTPLLGAGSEERDTLGQLYAAQLASHLSMRNPDDRRTLVLGLGMEKVDTSREAFFDILELVQHVL